MSLTDKEIEINRQRIVDLLRATQRPGIDKVLAYLDESGFYYAPSSKDRHHNWRGGLAQHALGVCENAIVTARDLPLSSLIICGLLHDVCKARMLYYDNSENICHNHIHIKGHGSRSIKLLKLCELVLNEEESLAIRWHMGGHLAKGDEKAEVAKAKASRLWLVIYKADKKNATTNNQ